MLGLLLAVSLSQTPQSRLFVQPNLPRSSAPSFVVAESIDFTTGAGVLPAMTGQANGVALFQPAVGGGATWEGYDNTGTAMAGTAQGTSTTFVGTFAPGVRAMQDVTDAKAPNTSAATVRSIFSGDRTIICAGYATTRQSNTSQIWWEGFDGTRDPLGYSKTGSFSCSNDGNSHHADSTTGFGQPVDGWSIVWCRQSGTQLCAGAQDVASEQCITSSAPGQLTSSHVTMGSGWGTGNAMRGQLAWCAFYSADMGLPFINDTIWHWWGVAQSGLMLSNAMTHDVPQRVGKDNTPTTGYVDVFNPYAVVADSTGGVTTQTRYTNYWATDPLDVSSWSTTGAPTVTGNLIEGPFGRRLSTTPCGRVSGAAGVGVVSASVTGLDGGTSGWYNASVFAVPGDAGASTVGRIKWVTDGTLDGGNFDALGGCDFATGADAGRFPLDTGCYAWIDGASSIKAQVLLSTGSLHVCQAQLTNSLFPQAPTIDNGAKGIGWVAVDGGALPGGAVKGGLEVVVRLPISSDQYAPLGNAKSVSSFLEDAFASATPAHIITHVYGDQVNTPAMLAILYGPSFGTENYLITPLVVPARTWSAVAIKWTVSGSHCIAKSYFNVCSDQSSPASCRATTLINSGTPGECPNQADSIYLGNRYDSSDSATANFAALRVYR